jgi:hypothetical protein
MLTADEGISREFDFFDLSLQFNNILGKVVVEYLKEKEFYHHFIQILQQTYENNVAINGIGVPLLEIVQKWREV